MDFSTIIGVTISHILFGTFCFWAGRNPVESRKLWESVKKTVRSLLKKDKATPEADAPP